MASLRTSSTAGFAPAVVAGPPAPAPLGWACPRTWLRRGELFLGPTAWSDQRSIFTTACIFLPIRIFRRVVAPRVPSGHSTGAGAFPALPIPSRNRQLFHRHAGD